MLNKLKNLIGGNSDGFYLEIDENDSQPTPEQTKTAPPEKQKQPDPVAEAPVAETKPEPVAQQSTKKSTKTSVKSKKKTSAETAPTAKPVASASSSTSSWEQPAWVKAMYNNNSSSSNGNGSSVGGEQTFATDNLLPTPSNYRRRPGPSLDKFKEMARQAKTSRR